jgi:hypothetical protein
VNRDTGARYLLVHFDPTLSEHPPDTGVTAFWVTGDGYLVYLREVDTNSRGRTVVQGTVGEVKVW